MSEQCTSVSPECPVTATLYGYHPNLGANTFFTVLFGILLIAQIILGVWKRTWTYMTGVALGCLGELLGYAGRLMLHANPWSQAGLEIEICCLVIAPSFLAAGVYLTLKHIVIHCGPEYSRLPPKWYPRIFILCDAGSIAIQAIGGGIAAAASHGSKSLSEAGDAMIIAGIAFQVATMAGCGVLAADYYMKRKAAMIGKIQEIQEDAIDKKPAADYGKARPSDRQFHIFCFAISFAYVTILIRCIYRIHEMAGGWGNPRMRDELLFLILDGMMVALATIALTVAHPGIMFKPMCTSARRES